MNSENILDQSEYSDEKIILVLKQHPWYFFRVIILALISLIIVLVSYFYLGINKITTYLILIAIIINVLFFIVSYYKWVKTFYIVTNHRVLTYIQEGLFSYNMQEVALENILFMSHEIKGPINNMINRGSVHIRASGVIEDEIVFENITNPYEAEKQIAITQKKYTNTQSEIKGTNDKSEKNKKEKTIIR